VILVYYLRLVLEVLFALSLPVGFSAIGLQFYEHRRRGAGEESGRPESESMREKAAAVRDDVRRRRRRRIPAAAVQVPVFLLTAGLFVWYNLGLLHGQFNIDAEDIHVLEVTAHRGASKYYPENTMPAFAGAVEQGADWIELDVQQSRDGQIFVMHDRNFRRTCGVNAFAWEIDYEKIRGFDAGRWFDRKSRGVYPPLLSEVIELARLANVRLNIELKPSGYEKNFEEGVLAVIREKHFEKNCVITSQKYSVLEKVKQIDPQIRTVYVMQVAYGRIDRLKAADDFSIEETFASARLIRRMHALGHHVYVWTVNNRRSINNVILNLGDNIITDNVPLAKECIHSSALTERMNRLVVSIEDLMY
jgi:glycerophosphoryl diester phosphodiesterase